MKYFKFMEIKIEIEYFYYIYGLNFKLAVL